jgi:hypothetical protein
MSRVSTALRSMGKRNILEKGTPKTRTVKKRKECTHKNLINFSNKHYTYINQVFGDRTIRQIIEEEYPTTWVFNVQTTGADFNNSYHHTVKDRETGQEVCSGEDGLQNLAININDTLCQSYSLMNYFEIPIPEDQKEKQMAMIKMYRDIINGTLESFEGTNFKEIIKSEILDQRTNRTLWRNYVSKGHVNMDTLFKNINDTLDEWEDFGYWFFIGKGVCPRGGVGMGKKKSKAKSRGTKKRK